MSSFHVRAATEDDIRALAAPGGLGTQFFVESEFSRHCTLDLELWEQFMLSSMASGHMVVLVGFHRDELAGFVAFTVGRTYTVEPLAMLYLFYVGQKRRLSRLGLMLAHGAEGVAEAMGAKLLYMGATANIGGDVDRRMMNMLDKLGYERLAGVSRKVLGG